MRSVRQTSKSGFVTSRRVNALLCFAALVLMYAQIASATVMMVTGACCSGDQCPIHGHHHAGQKNDNVAMDCGHDAHDMSKMSDCSMSCCHNVESSAIHANLFVLTPLSVSTPLTFFSGTKVAPAARNISQAFAPVAPPPKSFLR